MYDSETGLYYLQSRYYDPETSRFISADEPELIGHSGRVLTCNPYAYCENNPVNMVDYWGTDAIWLQATESVFGLGHTGLIFQYNKNWYYWYWGMASIVEYLPAFVLNSVIAFSQNPMKFSVFPSNFIGNTLAFFRVALSTILSDLSAKSILCLASASDRLNQYDAKLIANQRYDSQTKFDKSLYFKGTFENAYNYFVKLQEGEKYNLLNNNCMQTTVEGLLKGNFAEDDSKNRKRLKKAKNMVIPNLAYNYLNKYFH